MQKHTPFKQTLLMAVRGLYVLATAAIVILSLSALNLGGH